MRHADPGLGRVLRAEFTKFRSVRGTTRCLLAAAGFLVMAALFASSGSPGTYAQHDYVDQFRFAHQTLDGDGAITARLRSQRSDHPWAMAGIMVKAGTTSGSPYAALMVTPGHGVRLQAEFHIDTAGSTNTAPRWLKLARSGDRIIGYESADRKAWTEVGAVTLRGLPTTVEVGLFVTSPSITRLVPLRPAISRTVPNTATFDEVLVEGRLARDSSGWLGETVGSPRPEAAEVVPADGELTVTGSGDIIGQADDGSRILAATAGTIAALVPIVLLGVSLMTSEYEPPLIWSTFTATPRRRRVFVAKAIVLAVSTFVVALGAGVIALLAAQPLLRRQGYDPPTYPNPSLADPTVLRVLAGTAFVLATLALLGLAVGAIVRHSAAAVTIVLSAVLVPVVVAPFLPHDTGHTLQRLGPLAGLSVQAVKDVDDAFLVPWAGRPLTGVLVLATYTTIALALGSWLLRGRDA